MGFWRNQLSGPTDPIADANWTQGESRKGFFTDTSICIGCKACEVACKEWNRVPARTDADGKPQPLVAILWGRNAQSLEPLLTNAFIIKSPHPSPLSASRGFFGSKPFSRANQALVTMGADPVDWTL